VILIVLIYSSNKL